MGVGVFEILLGVGALFLGLYYYLTSNFDFWRKRNVKGPKPIPIFGNFKDLIFGKINISLFMKHYYDEYKDEAFVGLFGRSSPVLLVRDPDYIKDILIKDFHVFPDRGLTSNQIKDPFNDNLLNLEHKRWRPLRNKLSPVFTSGKLRDMFYLITECSHRFEEYVEKLVEKAEPIECRELTAKFTTDSIGVCAFGLNTNALGDENSGFRNAGRQLMESNLKNVLRRMLREWMPRIYNVIRPLVVNSGLVFLTNSMRQTIEYRRTHQERRNDFVDLLMDLKKQPEQFNDFEFTEDLMIAQGFIFFIAGFETSSTTVSNALYELALNPDVQTKLREELRQTIKQDGKFTYDNIKKMKYLDKVFKETLRKYPPGSFLSRKSVETYTFKGSDLTIPKETKIIIPVWGIHNDPELYPNPDQFDPERFSEENEKARHPMNYLPFGDGPHICIGMRFAQFQSKIGIAVLINKFAVEVCDKTCIPYRVHPRSFVPAPIGGIYLKFKKV